MTKSTRHVDVLILGGGPAGLTAAIYASRANLDTLVVEKMVYGGQISGTEHVENYPGFAEPIAGWDLAEAMRAQAEKFETKFLTAEATSLVLNDDGTKTVGTSEGEIVAKAVVLATGSRPRKMDVEGEEEFWGRGISTCATCDGALFRNKEVIVLGGGDAAVEEGIFLTKFASKVTVIHRRDKLRATPIIQKRAFANEKMTFVWNSVVTRYLGGEVENPRTKKMDKKLVGVEIENVETGEKSEVLAPGVFLFIGHIPNTDIVKDLVELNDHGLIKAQLNTKTSVPGLYAAGDLRVGAYMQAVTAAADGCMAALNAQHYIAELNEKLAEAGAAR
jgi:thioredoxin reductase (NADPH)